MLEIEKMIEGKTLEELKPKNENIVYPSERAPYALKILQEKMRLVEKMEELKETKQLIEEELKKSQEEYDALFRL